MTATASSIQVDAPALGGRELISLNLNIAILLWARYTGSGDFTPELFSWLATDRLSAAASCPLNVVPEHVGSSGPPWRLSAVKGSSAPRRTPDETSRYRGTQLELQS